MKNFETKRWWAFWIFLLISILMFKYFYFFNKNDLGIIISFNIFGLSLAALTASMNKDDQNYKKQKPLEFVIEYFYFFDIAILVGAILYIILDKLFIGLDISSFLFYLIGFTSSLYLMSHIDFLKKHLLFFIRTS